MTEGESGTTPSSRWPDAGSLGAVYSSIFSLLGARPRPIFGLFIGASAITLGLQYAAIWGARVSESDAVASTFAYIVPIIVYVVVGSFATAAIAGVIAAHLAGSEVPGAGAGLRSVRAMLKDVIASGLLASLLCLLITFPLFFTTLLFLPFFYGPVLVAQTVVIQRLPFNHAVGTARRLARGSTGRLLGYAFVIALSAWIVPVATVGFLDQLDPPGFPWAWAPLQVVVEGAASAVFAVASAVMYFDLRLRKDGFGAKELRAKLAES